MLTPHLLLASINMVDLDSGSQATALVLCRRSRGNAAVIGSKIGLASGPKEGGRVTLSRDSGLNFHVWLLPSKKMASTRCLYHPNHLPTFHYSTHRTPQRDPLPHFVSLFDHPVRLQRGQPPLFHGRPLVPHRLVFFSRAICVKSRVASTGRQGLAIGSAPTGRLHSAGRDLCPGDIQRGGGNTRVWLRGFKGKCNNRIVPFTLFFFFDLLCIILRRGKMPRFGGGYCPFCTCHHQADS